MSGGAMAAPYIFISYASADRERVLPVVEALQRAGVPVWIDRAGIRGGENYGAEINAALQGCAALVLMTSAAALASRNVRQEIALAWEYERPYLPLLLETATIPGDVRYWLTAAQWVEVLDRPESAWLPEVLTALAPLGIAPPPPVPAEAARLAGREREQILLRERLAAALAGQGGLVLIGGEAGVGKTTLVEAALAEAAALGALVLVGRCYDLSETPPYGPWLEITAAYPGGPGLPPLPAAVTDRTALAAVASQVALFDLVIGWFAAVAAARPLVLLLDDLHWADTASLDLLRALARRAPALRLLLLVTYRDDELTRRHPLAALLPLLDREAHAARVELRRFDAEGVRALVAAQYALPTEEAARLVAWLVGRAEGNAFFTTQLLRALEEAGALRQDADGWSLGDLGTLALPAALRQVLDARLARLGEEALRLVALSAVIGQEVPLALWAAVAETDEDGLLDAIEQAVAARLVTETPDGQGVRFAHALIREALYEGTLATRRRRVHRRAAEALAATAGPDPDAVAYHFQRAGDERASEWLIQAGERAQAAFAWLAAAARFEAALAQLENDETQTLRRAQLHARLAMLRRFADPRASLVHLDEALRLVTNSGDPAVLAHLTFTHGICRGLAGDVRAGVDEMLAGAASLAQVDAASRVRLAEEWNPGGLGYDPARGPAILAEWLAVAGRLAEARDYGERLRTELLASRGAPGMRDTALIDTYRSLGTASVWLGQAESARDAFRNARLAAGQDHLRAVQSLGGLSWVLVTYYTDQLAERGALHETLRTLSPRAADTTGTLNSATAYLAYLEGRWDAARPGLLALSRNGPMNWRSLAVQYLGPLAFAQGDWDLVASLVREWLPDGPTIEPGATFLGAALALQRLAAGLALGTGDLPLARSWLECHIRWMDWSGAALGLAEGQLGWAEYHRAAGDPVRARESVERAHGHASEPRQPVALLAAHRLLGELDTDADRLAEAAEHLDASLALADACGVPYERALTLLAQAELRAAMGQAEAARALVAEVRGVCERLGARPALARAAALTAHLEAAP